MRRSVIEYLTESSIRYPEKTAIRDKYGTITFELMYKNSLRIGSWVAGRFDRKKPVAVLSEKKGMAVCAYLGIAMAGCFYSPIDSNMPTERICKIMDVLQPVLLVCDNKSRGIAGQFRHLCEVVSVEDILEFEVSDDGVIEERISSIIDTDLLYVLFTSGSTGVPKGVMITHRSVIDYTDWVTKTFGMTSDDIIGNQAPFYFDNSVLDIYQMLSVGAELVIIDQDLFKFPIRLLECISENTITTIFWVPSLLCTVANLRALGKRDISCLKRVLFAGEVMPVKQLKQWMKAVPNAMYANLYGPTEITVDCTYYIVDRELSPDESVPIGRACENTDIMVLDEDDHLITDGRVGELCVRGSSLSPGYYNNIPKTEEVFVQNPLNHSYKETVYRTGDLVKYNSRGELVFVSRKDFQIKHLGHRIELGEIESAALSLERVDSACCLYDEQKKRIHLFYSGKEEPGILKGRLQNMLPEYMLPAAIHDLDRLPVSLNGKTDRKRLKELMEKEGK